MVEAPATCPTCGRPLTGWRWHCDRVDCELMVWDGCGHVVGLPRGVGTRCRVPCPPGWHLATAECYEPGPTEGVHMTPKAERPEHIEPDPRTDGVGDGGENELDPPTDEDIAVGVARDRLHRLRALVQERKAEAPDYPDSPEQIEEQRQLAEALDEPQMRAMWANDKDDT